MIEYLKKNNLIDLQKLLLLRGKELFLSDNEIYLLLHIINLEQLNGRGLTIIEISKYVGFTDKVLDDTFKSLLNKELVANNGGLFKIAKLEQFLLGKYDMRQKEDKPADLITVFQENMGRLLSPIEMEVIRNFVMQGYSEQMIKEALKEAVKAGVPKLNYIEKILINWRENGVSHRYDHNKPQREVDYDVVKYDWLNRE
ncbi:MAG: DnaD domain protein [Erysipelotrichaceae bacterium]|nr:DnaD domain protein [Erysipelotrichaceae bacterium]MDD3809944.1 DnaD domain protein [Erysipelotrichaceae bacterium]